jgi:aminoglycoside 6'-N-acetyltransferase
MMISFIPFSENHLKLFRSWLEKEHVKSVWQEPEGELELREKFLVKLPARGVSSFIFTVDAELTGYIQYYHAPSIGGGWWENELPGTYGIDLMIGKENKIGLGIGPNVIKNFISFLQDTETNVKSIIIDPEPTNLRAITAFEKAGFVRESEIKTPGGHALLMRLNFTD